MSVLKLLDGKDVLIGVIDVATDKIETPEEVAAVIGEGGEIRARGKNRRLHQLRHGADAPRHRRKETRSARRAARRWRARNSADLPQAPNLAYARSADAVASRCGSILLKFGRLDAANRKKAIGDAMHSAVRHHRFVCRPRRHDRAPAIRRRRRQRAREARSELERRLINQDSFTIIRLRKSARRATVELKRRRSHLPARARHQIACHLRRELASARVIVRHRSLRESTSINSLTLRRCSALLPDAIACSTQCAA